VVRRTRAYLVTGALSREFYPTAVYPKQASFNSAFVYEPAQAEPLRYDKVHLVLFGEYVPFRGGRFHFLYEWLNSITPWGQSGYEYSLHPGKEFTVFRMTPRSEPDKSYAFGTPICYEDVMPYISRRFVLDEQGRKRADFLVNISNDGWFGRGSELIQHLALAVFRCVENRVGMVRSVNTGVSAFIKPTGEIYSPVQKDGRLRGEDLAGWSLDRVLTDSRVSLYSRWGDWFPAVWTVLIAGAFLDALLCRRRRSQAARANPEKDAGSA
jgi:apolipoprotein N-acyltransferase